MKLRPSWLLVFALACLPACSVYYFITKTTGIDSPEPFVVRKEIPPDFHLAVTVRDALEPATDYLLEFDRSGKAAYDITVRAPRRRQQSGEFEITEEQVVSLWKAVQKAQFDELPERFPDDGDGKDKKLGVQKYYVMADKVDRRVEAYFEPSAALETVRRAAVAVVPPEVMAASGAPGHVQERPKQYQADTATRIFHMPKCARLKDVAPANTRPFDSAYDALDYGFQPCPECEPLKVR